MQGTYDLLQTAEDATPSSTSDIMIVDAPNQRALLLPVAWPSRRRHVERLPRAASRRRVASRACAVPRVRSARAEPAEAARRRVVAIARPHLYRPVRQRFSPGVKKQAMQGRARRSNFKILANLRRRTVDGPSDALGTVETSAPKAVGPVTNSSSFWHPLRVDHHCPAATWPSASTRCALWRRRGSSCA